VFRRSTNETISLVHEGKSWAMRRHLPHLSAIQGFEAAARHLSFKRAADELNLTQSAVSHQVKALEAFLGVPLFQRAGNQLELTDEGRDYLVEVTAGLERLEAGTGRICGDGSSEILSVRGTPAFIARWLTPRIDRFRQWAPGVELQLTTGLPPTDFSSRDVDVIIHWGEAPVPGVRVDPFLSSARFPVCSPDLVRRLGPFRRPADLARATLLHDMVGDGWQGWLERLGAAGFAHEKGPRFGHCELTLGAAERGQGVALAYGALIETELADGKLVRLFDEATEPVLIYSLACLEGRAEVPKIAAFRTWVMAEVGAVATRLPASRMAPLHVAARAG
jgi:LysR family transcriptional regulator, glycine cleavage system transcriptional activator